MLTPGFWQARGCLSSEQRKGAGSFLPAPSFAVQPVLVADLDTAVELAAEHVVDRRARAGPGQAERRVLVEHVVHARIDLDVPQHAKRRSRVPLEAEAMVGDRRVFVDVGK